jgi:hypothetical protein
MSANRHILSRRLCAVSMVLAAALVLAAAPVLGVAEVVVLSVDPAGVGYNDPTPVAPVGGNPGTTLGAQRLIAAQFAATLWGATLTSNEPVFVAARFLPQTCTATSAVLASASTTFVFANFAPGIFPETWYHSGLADSIAGVDLNPGFFDISTTANINLNGNPACLGGRGWYYGLDGNEGINIDFVAVLTHEFAHGLGHSGFTTLGSGAPFGGRTDVYARNTLDDVTGLHWNDMTNAQRAASALNCRNVSWDGASATAIAADFLAAGTPLLTVHAPASIARGYAIGAAQFGPPVSAPGVTGSVVLATDASDVAGPSTTDGCSTITNAAAVAGNLALIDRGTCGFAVKAKNAQDAGAVGVVIANNVAGCPPPGLGGVDPTVVIPTASVTLPDANIIKAALPGVSATLGVDGSRLAGANAAGNPLLFSTNPIQGGSSISHWETSTVPNTLMEPAVNPDLAPTISLDLSPGQMEDVGWTLGETTFIEGCDTGIGLIPFLASQVEICRLNAKNHGKFVSCVTHLGNDLKKAGLISGSQKGQLTSCAGGSSLP